MRLRIVLGLIVSAACGDPKEQPSDALPEPWPPVVDAACPVEFSDSDGGQLSVEYIHYDSDLQAALGLPPGVTTQARVMAFFMTAQVPNHVPLPVPGQCVDLEATHGWPLSQGTARTEISVGTLDVMGKNATNEDVDLVVPSFYAGTDAMGRAHDFFYQHVHANADEILKPDSSYTITFSGSPPVPQTTHDNAIFIPASFDVTTPALDDDGPLTSTADYTVHWMPAPSANIPAGDELISATWLADTSGKPTHFCATLQSQGQFTLPKAAIAAYKSIAAARGMPGTKVLLIRQAFDHKLQQLPTTDPCTKRRLDMLGSVSWVQQMDVN